MKRRILFVTPSLKLPADSCQLQLLSAELSNRNYDVHIAAICDPAGSENRLINASVYSLGIGRIHEPRRLPHHSVALARATRDLFDSLRPDIVHSWDADSRLELAWAKKYSVHASTRNIETVSRVQTPNSGISRLIQNQITPFYASFVVPHECLIAHLTDAGCQSKHIRVIPNAVALNQSSDRSASKRRLTNLLGVPESVYLATTFAPLAPKYRLKDLLWATDLLTCIRDDFHFLIVGRGKQKTRLRKFASQTEASRHVHIMDVPPESLTASDIDMGSDVYWNASLNSPLPSPMMQAMANGTPAISVLGTGTGDLIRHQETGFAVNFGARDEFARWTKYLIEQVDSADQLRLQGQAYVKDNYPVDAMVRAYEDVYEKD